MCRTQNAGRRTQVLPEIGLFPASTALIIESNSVSVGGRANFHPLTIMSWCALYVELLSLALFPPPRRGMGSVFFVQTSKAARSGIKPAAVA